MDLPQSLRMKILMEHLFWRDSNMEFDRGEAGSIDFDARLVSSPG